MMSITQILNQDLDQRKLMAAVNLGNKGPKKLVLMIVIDWNLARSLGKICCVFCK